MQFFKCLCLAESTLASPEPWALCSWSGSTQLYGFQMELWYRHGSGPGLYPWSKLKVPEWTFLTALTKWGEKSLMTEDCSTSVKTTRPRNAVETSNSCLCILSPMSRCYLMQVKLVGMLLSGDAAVGDWAASVTVGSELKLQFVSQALQASVIDQNPPAVSGATWMALHQCSLLKCGLEGGLPTWAGSMWVCAFLARQK